MLFFLACICYFITPVLASERFVDNGNGTITDVKTGLMWVASDNAIPISWPDAVEFCKNLRTGRYTDWRMPTLAELQSLYNPNEKNMNGYHITSKIFTTAQSCWASETEGYTAGRFNYAFGTTYWIRQSFSGATRVLAVRINK